MIGTITPKGWDSFQHYKDRKPAWIKLHRDLLDNYDFHCLPVASRALAPCLWLLASEYEGGEIPADWGMIAFRLRLSPSDVEQAVSALIDKGFFVASTMLADRKQSACLEREVEREVERELLVPNGTSSSSPAAGDDHRQSKVDNVPKAEAVPYQAIIDLYHKMLCPPMQRCLVLSDKRKSHMRQRWNGGLGSLDEWTAYFGFIAKSEFLMGRSASSNGRKPFIADLDWVINATNYVKIAERKYHQ